METMVNDQKFWEHVASENAKKRKCKCGNIVKITNNFGRKICSNCGYYVFLDKKDEFAFRVKEKMKK